MVKVGAMALKVVVPGDPRDVEERELLEKDLHGIGCHGFLEKPWNLKMEGMATELIRKKDNQWLGTIKQAPQKWTSVECRKVYEFPRQGEGMASRTDRFIDGKFSTKVNPKDGYVVFECKDVRARWVLEFLIPILHPGKANLD